MTLRNYITTEDLEQYADITVTDELEASDQINQAEEIIDAYVGFHRKFLQGEFLGKVESATDNTLVGLNNSPLGSGNENYFAFCVVEIIAGTGAGQKRHITSFSKSSRTITVGDNWETNPDNTSVYKITQVGKFPRVDDVSSFESTHYKVIPEAIKRAVCAQLQYIIERGVDFFVEGADFQEESIGDYSYVSKENINRLIAPKARLLLKGYKNIKGSFK